MPTSCSIDAAHRSSRSPSAGVNSPPLTSESNICSESIATCSTWAMSDSYWIGEVADGGAADVVEQRRVPVEQRAGEEHSLAQAGLGGLDPVEVRRARRRCPARRPTRG